MKKTYSILAALAMTISAAASNFSLPADILSNIKQMDFSEMYGKGLDSSTIARDAGSAPNTMVMKSARKADANTSIEGDWDITIGDYYDDYSTRSTLVLNCTATMITSNMSTYVLFEEKTGNFEFPIVASFSPNTGLVWFDNFLYDDDGVYSAYQEPFVWTGNSTENKIVTARYNQEEGTIDLDPDCGIAVVIYQNKENPIVYYMFDIIDGVKSPNWKLLGKAMFKENITYPIMTGEENLNAIQLSFYQNEDEPTKYKIEHPLKSTFDRLNEANKNRPDQQLSFESMPLIIDASDPDNVLVEKQSTGLNTRLSNKITGIMSYFSDSWNYANFGTIIHEEGIQIITMSDVDDEGVVTISFPPYSCVLFGPSTQLSYKCPYASELRFFPNGGDYNAVEDILDDNTQYPVEYFSIQGIRVANPEKGQLLIKKQGNKTEKIIY